MSLREAREHAGLTQHELSAASGVDQGLISKFETAIRTNPTVDTARRLEAALKLKPGTLVFGERACEVTK